MALAPSVGLGDGGGDGWGQGRRPVWQALATSDPGHAAPACSESRVPPSLPLLRPGPTGVPFAIGCASVCPSPGSKRQKSPHHPSTCFGAEQAWVCPSALSLTSSVSWGLFPASVKGGWCHLPGAPAVLWGEHSPGPGPWSCILILPGLVS